MKKESKTFWPVNEKPFLHFLKYLRETYFDPCAQFNFKLWNHFNQLLTFNNPDSTTNCCESINSGLNKDCPPLRTTNSVFNKVLKHKQGFLNKYSYVVELDNLSLVRRPKKQTEQYETLLELCESFDNFSESERKLNLFKYLGLFSRRDAIPDQYYEDPDDPESVLPENLENPK